MNVTIAALCCILIASSGVTSAQDAPAVFGLAPCTAAALSLTVNSENGDGMSHSGTRVVVRNVSDTACTFAPASAIALHARGSGVQIATDVVTPFDGPTVNGHRLSMGHGPVVLPIALRPGAAATADVRWISGAVYNHSTCVDVTALTVNIGGTALRTPVGARICGPDATHLTVQAHRFTSA